MLDMLERWVQFHELYLKSEPEDAPKIELRSLAPLWISRIRANQAVKLIKKDTAAIRIVDVMEQQKSKTLILLLQYTDTNVTDPAFSNLETGQLRVEPKLEGEGIAVSAHAVIALEPHDKEGLLYKILLEEVPGLGRSAVGPFIRSELKEIAQSQFQYNDIDANNVVKNYLPASEILGTPSKQFIDELEEGCVLQSIELVKLTSDAPEIDEEGFYTETSRHIRLVPEKQNTSNLREAIEKVRRLAKKEGYNNIKFRYKHPQGKLKTTTMGSTIGDMADALILRSEPIKSEEILGQCSQKIVESFAKQMVKLMTT